MVDKIKVGLLQSVSLHFTNEEFSTPGIKPSGLIVTVTSTIKNLWFSSFLAKAYE